MSDVASTQQRDTVKRKCDSHLRAQINALVFGNQLSHEELWGLTFDRVDFADQTADVKNITGRKRKVDLPNRLFSLIQSQRTNGRNGLVFPCEGGRRCTHGGFSFRWRRELEANGIPGILKCRAPSTPPRRIPTRSKESGLTYKEAAVQLGVTKSSISKWHVREGHPSLGRASGGGWVKIAKAGTWTDSHGRTHPLLSPLDIQKIDEWMKPPPPSIVESELVDGIDVEVKFLLISSATKHFKGTSYEKHLRPHLLHWTRHECFFIGRKVDHRSHIGRISSNQIMKLVYVKEDDVLEVVLKIEQTLLDDRQKWDSAKTVAKAIGETHGKVCTWLQRESCPLLNRKLNAEKLVAFENGWFRERWKIEPSETRLLKAVTTVYEHDSVIAAAFGMHPRTLRYQLKRGSIAGLAVPQSAILKVPARRGSQWRLHSSVIVELAKALGKPKIAAKYRRRLKKKIGKGKSAKSAKTAEQLAAGALAHWTDPEADQESNGQTTTVETVPADQPPASTNGKVDAQQDQGEGTVAGEGAVAVTDSPETSQEAKGRMPSGMPSGRDVEAVLRIIRDYDGNPKTREIAEALGHKIIPGHLNNLISNLKARGRIANNGKRGMGASGWWLNTEAPEPI